MQQQALKKPIKLQVKTKQKRKGEPLQTFRTVTEGTLYQKDSFVYITYDESDESGLGLSKTTLKIDPAARQITVIRFGATQMKYIWGPGQTSQSLYQTSFGTFEMTVRTDHLRIDVTDPYRSGNLKVEYRLEFGGHTSRMTFDLIFSELPSVQTELSDS